MTAAHKDRRLPDARQIDEVLPTGDRAMCAVIGVSTKPSLRDRHARLGVTIAQSSEEDRHHDLRRPVDIVALPAPIAGNRSNHRDRSFARCLEGIGHEGYNRNDAERIGPHLIEGCLDRITARTR